MLGFRIQELSVSPWLIPLSGIWMEVFEKSFKSVITNPPILFGFKGFEIYTLISSYFSAFEDDFKCPLSSPNQNPSIQMQPMIIVKLAF